MTHKYWIFLPIRIGSTFRVGRKPLRSAGHWDMREYCNEAVVCEANQEIGTNRKGFPVRIELFRPVNRWFMTISVFSLRAVYVSVWNRFQSSVLRWQKRFPVQRKDRKPRREITTRHHRNSHRTWRIFKFRRKFWVNSCWRRTFRSSQQQTRQNLRLGLQLASSTCHDRQTKSSSLARCFFHFRRRRIN